MLSIRGVLETLVLAVVEDQPLHGYGIAARLEELGAGEVQGGTLYPVLKKLSNAGWIEADWSMGDHGPAKKIYRLTDEGVVALREQRSSWAQTRDMVDSILAIESEVAR